VQNDQPPPADIMRGELLLGLCEVNALQEMKPLEAYAFVFLLRRGMVDFTTHVALRGCTSPDIDQLNRFAQYGVRVSAILISPWIDPQVFRRVDHTSLLAVPDREMGTG